MSIDFAALNQLSYGMFVVTAMDGETPVGCIANVCAQITSQPANITVCLHKNNYTTQCIAKSKRVCINILDTQVDPSIIQKLGFRSGRDGYKFDGIDLAMENGLPVVSAAMAYIQGDVVEALSVDTHTLFVVRVDNAAVLAADAIPMTYAYYKMVIKGMTGVNSPTFRQE